MSLNDTYWNNPRAYYMSAAFLFIFMAFMIIIIALWPDFWNSIDPLFSFVGFVGIFAPAGLGVFMIFLGRNLAGRKTAKS